MQELNEENISKNATLIGESSKSKIIKYLRFLVFPNYRLDELTIKRIDLEKLKSKRKPLRKLNSKLTIIGIILIFFILNLAVFSYWKKAKKYANTVGGYVKTWNVNEIKVI